MDKAKLVLEQILNDRSSKKVSGSLYEFEQISLGLKLHAIGN
jgi:hypothetical protein